MKMAKIRKEPKLTNDSKGSDVFKLVNLYIDGELFGTIDVPNIVPHYANDVVENWQNGILGEGNEHIRKSNNVLKY